MCEIPQQSKSSYFRNVKLRVRPKLSTMCCQIKPRNGTDKAKLINQSWNDISHIDWCKKYNTEVKV